MKINCLVTSFFSLAAFPLGVLCRSRFDRAAHVALARTPSGMVSVHVIDFEGHLIPWKRYHGSGITGTFNKYIKSPLKRLFNIGKEAKLRNVESLLKDAQRMKHGRSFCKKIDSINKLLKQVDPMATGAMNPHCKAKTHLARSVIVNPRDRQYKNHKKVRLGIKKRGSGCPPGWEPVSSMKHSIKRHVKNIKKATKRTIKGISRPFRDDRRVKYCSSNECLPCGNRVPNSTSCMPKPHKHSIKVKSHHPQGRVQHKIKAPRCNPCQYEYDTREVGKPKGRKARKVHHSAKTICKPVHHKAKYRGSCQRVHPRSQLGSQLMGVLRNPQRVYCSNQHMKKTRNCHYANVRHSVHGKKMNARSTVQWYQDPNTESGFCVRIVRHHHRSVQAPTVV